MICVSGASGNNTHSSQGTKPEWSTTTTTTGARSTSSRFQGKFFFLKNFSPLWYKGYSAEVLRLLAELADALKELGHSVEWVSAYWFVGADDEGIYLFAAPTVKAGITG